MIPSIHVCLAKSTPVHLGRYSADSDPIWDFSWVDCLRIAETRTSSLFEGKPFHLVKNLPREQKSVAFEPLFRLRGAFSPVVSEFPNSLELSMTDVEQPEDQSSAPGNVSMSESFRVWCRVAGLSFGGPAGQIAVMHRIVVDEKKWISEERFLHALNYCMLLPGPEAQQLATYIGWLMHGTRGGLMAGGLFVLPGFVSILALSIVYACFEKSIFVYGLFFGLKAAVMAIVVEAVIRIGKRVLKNPTMVALAIAAFIAIFFFDVPFPAVILAAGLIGLIGGKIAPNQFSVIKGHGTGVGTQNSQDTIPFDQHHSKSSVMRNIKVIMAFSVIWFAPIAILKFTFGPESIYLQESLFFSEAAVVTFGGAYSVLAYIAQQAVENYGWLKPGEMLDGLGMAETTPGPLIMVVQFVGFMGAYRDPGPFSPLMGGIVGSCITTWVTFVPCFFWIFLGAPYVERLRGNAILSSGLSAITATVVGVVMNLSIWFSLHTLFGKVTVVNTLGMRLQIPQWDTVNLASCAIAGLACVLTFYWKKDMVVTLVTSIIAGAAWLFFSGVTHS